MRNVRRGVRFVALLLPLAGWIVTREPDSRDRSPGRGAESIKGLEKADHAAQARVMESYGKLPLSFEANRGQMDSDVKFYSRGGGYGIFITPTEAVLSLGSGSRQETEGPEALKRNAGPNRPTAAAGRPRRTSVLRMKLAGANPKPHLTGEEELPGKVNYFIGNDPKKWRTNVSTYAKVRYREVYPGIDLVHYGNQRQLEYDFVVAPGADPKTIRLGFEGAEKMEIDARGDLLLHTQEGDVRQHKPVIYQETDGTRTEVSGNYSLSRKNQVSFEVGKYDPGRALVIDPMLTYSTYLGGDLDDYGWSIAVDSAGSAYVTGQTGSANFPTASPFQATGDDYDAFVTKLNATGAALVYSTYLGGSGRESGYGIAVDSAGNAYVTGETRSTNFPTASPFQAAFGGSADAFVTKLNATGSALVYSTYLGGNGTDDGSGIAIDSAGNAYLIGYTSSTNFPTASAFQATHGSGDAFVAKIGDSPPAPSITSLSPTLMPAGNPGFVLTVDGSNFVTSSAVLWNGSARTTTFAGSARLTASIPASDIAAPGTTSVTVSNPGGVISNASSFKVKPATRLTLNTGGTGTTSTGGTAANVRTGYATATVDTGVTPYGTAVFSLSQNGVVVSEAGVPASPPTQRARIFIDYRTHVPAGVGTLDIYTGFAIAHRGNSSAYLTYTLRDRNAQIAIQGHGSLAVGAHFAKFIHQLRDVAPDFNLPANVPTATRFGSLEIASSQPVSVVALRLTTNQRGETLLTSTPIADVSASWTSSPVYFPQLADGGGYATTLILLNTSNATEAGTLAVFDDNGARLTLRDSGGTSGSTFPYSMPAGGAFVFQTDGSPAAPRVGWVKATPNPGNWAPVGAGVFSYSPAGTLVTESGIPSAISTTDARIYVDKSGGHDTGLAIANPGGSASRVVLQAFQNDGGTAAGTGQAVLGLQSGGHSAKFVGQLIGGLPESFTGVVRITSASSFVALTLRSLLNGRGDFLLTTFPIADAKRPAPAPIVFPQIADGGGFATQFIFISATGPAAITVTFLGDEDSPLSSAGGSP